MAGLSFEQQQETNQESEEMNDVPSLSSQSDWH